MNWTNQNAELITNDYSLNGIKKQIETCARTCYKSEKNITETSCEKMVDMLISHKHTAMLEHGTVYLKLILDEHNPYITKTLPKPGEYYTKESFLFMTLYNKYMSNPYSRVISFKVGELDTEELYITTNYRVIVENHWEDDLMFLCEPTEYHIPRYTVKLTTSRDISHELVRHRVFSFAQESQRYCNYSSNKFNNSLTFIKPTWDIEDQSLYLLLGTIENTYNMLIKAGWKPEQARMILPNCTKTEICMTGFATDWRRFLDMRLNESTGPVHPCMKQLAQLINDVIPT